MKKWLFYALVMAAIPLLSFGGFGGEDVEKLHPVQVLMLREKDGNLELLADTEDMGIGQNIHQTVSNMKETATAGVFLDTADFLLLERGTEHVLPQLLDYLRPSCTLCYVTDGVDMVQAAEYLKLHEPELTLTRYEAGERQLPTLTTNEGRLKLVRS